MTMLYSMMPQLPLRQQSLGETAGQSGLMWMEARAEVAPDPLSRVRGHGQSLFVRDEVLYSCDASLSSDVQSDTSACTTVVERP